MSSIKISRRALIAGSALFGVQNFASVAQADEGKNFGFPTHDVLGHGIGIHPGRVVWVHDAKSVQWDGSGYWWELEHFNAKRIARMLDRALCTLTGEKTVEAAWQKLFENFNDRHGEKAGYRAGERIAVKVNMNGAGAYGSKAPGFTEESYGNAVLIRALALSLIEKAGVAPENITFYDAGRIFPEYLIHYVKGDDLSAVQFKHRMPQGDDDALPDKSTPVIWSGKVRGEASYIPQCVTQARYLINLANLKGHCYGMTLCGKNHFGSFINSDRMRAPQAAGLHGNVAATDYGDYSVIADLIAHKDLGGKTLLYLLDGLLTATGESVPLSAEAARWSMSPFNGGFCASLFASQDPVAIDSVGADFLMNEPNVTNRNRELVAHKATENYLHEAALANNAPSGTAYTDGEKRITASLGVHEHWDDVQTKRYGRNLGKNEGIELIGVSLS